MTNCPHCGALLLPEFTALQLHQLTWFDAFWQLYPRHVGKASAMKAFKKAATSENSKYAIMAGLKSQLPRMQSVSKEFIPHASTWLNGRRWEDDATPDVANATKRVAARVIECELCGDSGIMHVGECIIAGIMVDAHLERCSCSRGALPGLVIPQGEDCPF